MGRQPYAQFVKDCTERLNRSGGQAKMSTMFGRCDEPWKRMPEDLRKKYKLRAKTDQWSQEDAIQSYQYISRCFDIKDCKPDNRDISVEREERLEVEMIKQGVKRERDELIDSKALVSLEPADKRLKLYSGIPNGSNLVTGKFSERDRYAHYDLFMIRKTCDQIVSARERQILKMPLQSISVNVLCKHKENGEDVYVPIEIGIYTHSLESGQTKEPYHVLIDPGPVPPGCFNRSVEHAQYHKISFPGHSSQGWPAGARTDYAEIYKEMYNYLKDGQVTPLVSNASDINQVKGSIEWLHRRAKISDTNLPGVAKWTILPAVDFIGSMINYVYTRMLNNTASKTAIHYYLRQQLDNSIYDYNSAFMCRYHSKLTEPSKWCAQACASRTIINVSYVLDDILNTYNAAMKIREAQLALDRQQPRLAIEM